MRLYLKLAALKSNAYKLTTKYKINTINAYVHKFLHSKERTENIYTIAKPFFLCTSNICMRARTHNI